MHKKFKHSNRKSHYDFCVDYDFEKDTPEILVKRIMYSMFIRRRLKRNKPVIIFISGDSGEGKSYSALKIQEILCEVQGIPFLPHINDINIYTPLQYPEKIRKLLFDETNKNINLVTIHEAREVIKAKTWHSFVTQAISDINATARQVKPVIVMILSQFIRDITTDVRYTLNYYIKVERPPYSNYAELEFMKMWKDDTDLEKPKLCKARIKGLIRLPDGTHKVLRPKFIFTPVSKEVAEIFNKADYDAKKNIIKHKLDKIMKKMIEDIGMTSDKVDKMVKFYCDNPQNLVKIGKMKKNGRKWILNKDFKMMHDLSDGEGNEFATKLYAELNKKGIVESATPSIERGERVEEGLEVPEESEL